MKYKINQISNIKKLSEVCEIFSGGTPYTKNKNFWNGDICWLSSGETKNTFITNTERKITLLGVKNSATRLAKKFDVVVASAGQGNTRGQVSLCLIDTYVNQSVVVLRANNTTLLPKFLFYNMRSRYKELRKLSDGHSSRGSLPKNILSLVNIDLLTIHQQKKIGKIFYDLDMKIENLQNQNKILEQMAQSIFKSWFVDFDGITEFKDSELGKIPKEWKISKLGDECSLILGGTPSRLNDSYWKDGIVPWINSGKTNEFRIISPTEYITLEAVKKSATKLLPKKTSVLAITGATLGQISIIEIDTCTNQSVVGIVESDSIPTEYIYFWLHHIINKIINYQTGGAQQHINKTNIHNTKILIPLQSILNNYKKLTCPIFDKISTTCFEIKNLIEIRDILLPKLLSGEIKV